MTINANAGAKPVARPNDARFSPGPTRKFDGWSLDALATAAVGRSHRSKLGKGKLKSVIDRSKALLGMPDDWRVAIMPGSDTGAVECAMWNLFGARPAEILVWEAFGNDWAIDAVDELKIDAKVHRAEFGQLPDLTAINWDNDVCLAWNGTTSGVRMDGDAIPADRGGLVIADSTSAAFAMDIPWDKVDVVTWSWQKVLGGEAAHGMMALGPRAVARMAEYTPNWPIPKLYRIQKKGALDEALFEGATLNTPSMLAVEDCLAALDWAESIGGLPELIARSQRNYDAVAKWMATSKWAAFLAKDPATRSTTSICIDFIDPAFLALPDEAAKRAFAKRFTGLLEAEGVAFDIDGYRSAPPSFRIWGGGTVETADIEALLPWLDWAFETVKAEQAAPKSA